MSLRYFLTLFFGGIAAVAVLAIIAGIALQPPAGTPEYVAHYAGKNTAVYNSIAFWNRPVSRDEADKLVSDVAAAANVSHAEAERMTAGCFQAVDNTVSCLDLVKAARGMAEARREGIIQ